MKWIMGIGLPTILILLGVIVLIIKPKRNGAFGYRTKRSLSSDSNWNYANRVMGIALILINAILIIPLVCIVNLFVESTIIIVLLDIMLATIGAISVIPITEYKLTKRIAKEKNNEINS
ncbi:MAG: SdpI family protein [Clostridia bacterium]|nr:SdpI family protein [Clostridia bacterium]MDE7328283.1 SdpI family protein [Clostridia bacterium]